MVIRRALITLFLIVAFNGYAAETVEVKSLDISHKTTIVTVTTDATPLPATALSGRKVILVQNISSSTIYLGNEDVTADEETTGGYQLANEGDTWIGDYSSENIVYGIVAADTAKVSVWEAR